MEKCFTQASNTRTYAKTRSAVSLYAYLLKYNGATNLILFFHCVLPTNAILSLILDSASLSTTKYRGSRKNFFSIPPGLALWHTLKLFQTTYVTSHQKNIQVKNKARGKLNKYNYHFFLLPTFPPLWCLFGKIAGVNRTTKRHHKTLQATRCKHINSGRPSLSLSISHFTCFPSHVLVQNF